jgi:hypothetical protein
VPRFNVCVSLTVVYYPASAVLQLCESRRVHVLLVMDAVQPVATRGRARLNGIVHESRPHSLFPARVGRPSGRLTGRTDTQSSTLLFIPSRFSPYPTSRTFYQIADGGFGLCLHVKDADPPPSSDPSSCLMKIVKVCMYAMQCKA